MASTEQSAHALLSSIKTSLEASQKALPDPSLFEPVPDGISLLDVKADLFLSYIHHVVFLLTLRLDDLASVAACRVAGSTDLPGPSEQVETVLETIAELRLYLDKGVAPLEGKLKYEINRVLAVADKTKEAASQASLAAAKKAAQSGSDDSDSDSGAEEAAGPSLSAIRSHDNTRSRFGSGRTGAKDKDKDGAGVYRPPRFAPAAPPTALPRYGKPDEDDGRTNKKSRTLDEYVSTELSAAPSVMPSVGSNIAQMGRRIKSDKERRDEEEKRVYEEANFTRLPKKPTKKDLAANKRARRHQYGGEDWYDLNLGADKISKLTSKSSGRSRADDAIQRSRKRTLTSGPEGGDSYKDGDAFQQKRKKFMRMRGASA